MLERGKGRMPAVQAPNLENKSKQTTWETNCTTVDPKQVGQQRSIPKSLIKHQQEGRPKETEGRQDGHNGQQEGSKKETEGRRDGHNDKQERRQEGRQNETEGKQDGHSAQQEGRQKGDNVDTMTNKTGYEKREKGNRRETRRTQ